MFCDSYLAVPGRYGEPSSEAGETVSEVRTSVGLIGWELLIKARWVLHTPFSSVVAVHRMAAAFERE